MSKLKSKQEDDNRFVLKLRLHVSRKNNAILNKRLEAGRLMQNSVIREFSCRYYEMIKLPEWSAAFSLDAERKAKELNRIKHEYGFMSPKETNGVFNFVGKLRNKFDEFKVHLGSVDARQHGLRGFRAVERMMYTKNCKVHYKKRGSVISASGDGKDNIRYVDGYVYYSFNPRSRQEIRLRAELDPQNQYQSESLKMTIQRCAIIRETVGQRWAWYAMLTIVGKPPIIHGLENAGNVVGFDLGMRTIAVVPKDDPVSGFNAELCAGVSEDEKKIARIQRAMARSLRATNPPEAFVSEGTFRRGYRPIFSRGYKRLKKQLAKVQRLAAIHRKEQHGQLTNEMLSHGNVLRGEKLDFAAWAKKAKPEGNKRRKRFGKTVHNRAPGKLIEILRYKAKWAGGCVEDINPKVNALSQTCPRCGERTKHSLRCPKNNPTLREFVCSHCGYGPVQRDILSAFLAANTVDGILDVMSLDRDQVEALVLWKSASSLANRCTIGTLTRSEADRLPKGSKQCRRRSRRPNIASIPADSTTCCNVAGLNLNPLPLATGSEG